MEKNDLHALPYSEMSLEQLMEAMEALLEELAILQGTIQNVNDFIYEKIKESKDSKSIDVSAKVT